MSSPLELGQEGKKCTETTTTSKLTRLELNQLCEEMIPKFEKGKKEYTEGSNDPSYASLDAFLRSDVLGRLEPSHSASFRKKKTNLKLTGRIGTLKNPERSTKHRKNKDLFAPILFEWLEEKKVDNGKMKIII